ncbi:hypothetical protein J3492_04120 [Psychrobacter sp. F1192]|uniref:Uroporphyrin-3 C-methyltransferase n=1 Tax=Psychrobacter coccoides TaxID=2818440 RepID=A0ABS3NMT2_9GAMM|nr:hypothetical protein [Psychrobacter coccoides]MBO1530398.1 hypothetical protein [Psychrobacter coccoides]
MSTENESPADTLSALQQRRQASVLLLRVQWLLILLLIMAFAWLYIGQQRFQNQMNERLHSHEQVVSRLNEMDDRLFAISQQSLPEPKRQASSQAQNQLDLLRIQIQAVDRLLADNNYSAAIELLQGLRWQLSQSGNQMAPALTTMIKQSLNEDIERLQAQSSQPSPWQLQNIAIQDIQTFLQRIDGIGHTHSANQTQNTARISTEDRGNAAITRRQITIHEVIMTLNLAMQASNMHEKEQLVSYLQQARNQLQPLSAKEYKAATSNSTAHRKHQTLKDERGSSTEAPETIKDVMAWLDELIADAPSPAPLLTTQMLDKRQ